jgi:outer membrane lipoprotein LolB
MLALLLLAGCATRAPLPVGSGAASLQAAQLWSLDGKLGIKAADQSGNLGLRWEQDHDAYNIGLYGPLGVTVARISGDGQGATLELPDQPGRQAGNPEALVQAALGYPLPVTPMQYWVRGMPAPGLPVDIHKAGFRQLGWDVTIRQQGPAGPLKIQLQRPEVRLLLVVKEWRF